MNNEYFLGLDIGTESIGWAVTSTDYTLKKYKGKALWGIHLFETANSAVERRNFRSARRRTDRRKQRIKLLREFFEDEIAKVDSGFFQRLDESFFTSEDKKINQKNSLFNDKNYSDKDYHKEFKTIYHLRNHLINDDKKYDIRLIYLAIEHILKHRGHFLKKGETIDAGNDFNNIFTQWCAVINDIFDENVSLTNTKELEDILKSHDTVNNKKKTLKNLFGNDTLQSLVELLSGANIEISKVFNNDNYNENETKKVSFSDGNFDDNKEKIASEITENEMYVLDKTKELYDWGILADILSGSKYLSEAKVKIYDKHGEDLRKLKNVVLRLIPDKFNETFKSNEKTNNYTAYIGKCKINGRKENPKANCSREDFYKFIKGIFKNFKDDAEVNEIINEMDQGTFMPKQVSKDNSVIPYQLHLKELKEILKNASRHYEFLNKTDEYGSVSDKIISLLTFRIPYYVGPLNNHHKKYAWIEKVDGKSDIPIRPWNFSDVVNLEKSAESFIERMTNHCTYFYDEPVLAKSSILYSKYMVFNELNNIKINSEPLNYELKMLIYNDVFLTKANPKKKDVENAVKKHYGEKDTEISGLADDFNSNMKSYMDFKAILKDKMNTDISENIIDEIIRLITIFGSEKKMLINEIKKLYGDLLTESEINAVSKLKYSGWGRFSRKLLSEIYTVDETTGECISIISMLIRDNENFMQIINNTKYSFRSQIDDAQKESLKTKKAGSYKYLDDLYLSPSNKRRVWRTLVIVKEIVKIMKHPPKKIFIEMARGVDKGNDKSARRTQLNKLYEAIKKDKALIKEMENLDYVSKQLKDETDSSLRQKKLYLYYRQLGHCMYSGKPLRLEDLDICDIDHIIPQCLKKDDSLDNTVLVFKKLNGEKSDTYPIPHDKIVTEDARKLWKILRSKGFISTEKYNRLIRTAELTLEEKADFISRQLVDTQQTTKIAADILKQMYASENSDSKTEIVYVKAYEVSRFRNGGYITQKERNRNPELFKDDKLVKTRKTNDFHHAKDAYLNIVVGNIFNEKFNHNPLVYLKNCKYDSENKHGYNLKLIFDKDIEKANWTAGSQGTIQKIKQVLRKNNILFTRALREETKIFNKIQLVKKGGGTHPIKENDERFKISDKIKGYKYGGYNELTGAYYSLIECKDKNKPAVILESIPVYIARKTAYNENELYNYLVSKGYTDINILIPKIMFDTLFKINGFYMRIAGRSNNNICFNSAVPLCLSEKDEKYIKKIEKLIDYNKANNKKGEDINNKLSANDVGLTNEENIELYKTISDKLYNTIYDNEFFATSRKKIESAKEIFENLSAENQAIILNEILKLFSCNAELGKFKGTNIEELKDINDLMRIMVNKNLINKTEVKIINQSPTGIFEREVDVFELANRYNKEQGQA